MLVVHTWPVDEYDEEELLTGLTTDELELGCFTWKEEVGRPPGPDDDELDPPAGGAVVLDVWTDPAGDELVLLGLPDGGGPVGGGGMVVLPKDVTAFGITLVQSVSWLILLTPRRLMRT